MKDEADPLIVQKSSAENDENSEESIPEDPIEEEAKDIVTEEAKSKSFTIEQVEADRLKQACFHEREKNELLMKQLIKKEEMLRIEMWKFNEQQRKFEEEFEREEISEVEKEIVKQEKLNKKSDYFDGVFQDLQQNVLERKARIDDLNIKHIAERENLECMVKALKLELKSLKDNEPNIERDYAIWKLDAEKNIKKLMKVIENLNEDLEQKRTIEKNTKTQKSDLEKQFEELKDMSNKTTASNLKKLVALREKEQELISEKSDLEDIATKLRFEVPTTKIHNSTVTDKLSKTQREHDLELLEMKRMHKKKADANLEEMRALRVDVEAKETKEKLEELESAMKVAEDLEKTKPGWREEPREWNDMKPKGTDYNSRLADTLEKIWKAKKKNRMFPFRPQSITHDEI